MADLNYIIAQRSEELIKSLQQINNMTTRETKNAELMLSLLAQVGINVPTLKAADLIFNVTEVLHKSGDIGVKVLLDLKLDNETKWSEPPVVDQVDHTLPSPPLEGIQHMVKSTPTVENWREYVNSGDNPLIGFLNGKELIGVAPIHEGSTSKDRIEVMKQQVRDCDHILILHGSKGEASIAGHIPTEEWSNEGYWKQFDINTFEIIPNSEQAGPSHES